MIEYVIEDGRIRINIEHAVKVLAAKLERRVKGENVTIKVK